LKYIDNECHIEEGVWFLKGTAPFAYNDGDKEEKYILSAITKSKDITSDSVELESFIRDWPSKYHFSIERSFAYRSLMIKADMKVLEIGSGCGSITRYLGETGAEVLALEGSPRRARITRERTRDLDNVSVLSAPFDLVKFVGSFDLVVCNGVLEYSALFVKSEEPFEKFLKKCSHMLSPIGVLVVAIENQYGLRYFSSGKEEHTNVLYDGLHGYPARQTSARTFSRKVLLDLLEKTVGESEVLLPIPDYKFPRALIREELSAYVNFGELVADLQRYDFGSSVKPKLHERLVYHELGKSNLISEMSNSFFVLSGPGRGKLYRNGWLGSIFKNPRQLGLVKRADIYVDGRSRVHVTNGIDAAAESHQLSNTTYEENPGELWVNGISVHTLVSRAFCRRKYTSLGRQLAEIMRAWWVSLAIEGHCMVQGNNIDANWRNSKLVGGEVSLFDQEWSVEEPLSANWIIYRSVSQFYSSEFFYFHLWNWVYRWYPPVALMIIVGKSVGHKFKLAELWGSITQEAQFQKNVTGREINRHKMLISAICPLYVREFNRVVLSSFRNGTNRAAAAIKRLKIR